MTEQVKNPTDLTATPAPVAGSVPETPPATPVTPAPPPEKPDWLDEKYLAGGKTVDEAIKEQAKSKKAAEREMKLKEQEAALLRKELELAKQSRTVPDNPQGEMTPEIIKKLEEKYGMPIGEIQLRYDVAKLNNDDIEARIEKSIKPLKETLLSDKVNGIRQALKDDPVYKDYEYEFEAKINALPIEQRADKSKIDGIRQQIAVEHFQELIDKARSEGANSVRGKPATPPVAVGGQSAPPVDAPKPVLSEDARRSIEARGGDPAKVEAYIKGELPNQKASGWNSYLK